MSFLKKIKESSIFPKRSVTLGGPYSSTQTLPLDSPCHHSGQGKSSSLRSPQPEKSPSQSQLPQSQQPTKESLLISSRAECQSFGTTHTVNEKTHMADHCLYPNKSHIPLNRPDTATLLLPASPAVLLTPAIKVASSTGEAVTSSSDKSQGLSNNDDSIDTTVLGTTLAEHTNVISFTGVSMCSPTHVDAPVASYSSLQTPTSSTSQLARASSPLPSQLSKAPPLDGNNPIPIELTLLHIAGENTKISSSHQDLNKCQLVPPTHPISTSHSEMNNHTNQASRGLTAAFQTTSTETHSQNHSVSGIMPTVVASTTANSSKSIGQSTIDRERILPSLGPTSIMISAPTSAIPSPAHSSIASREATKKTYSLSDLHIGRTLGTGSFGRVHLAQLKSTNQFYALKVLRKSEIVKMRQVEHTINEKHILESLQFPFLVGMLAAFYDSVNLYFVLEYIQGGELFSYLRRCVKFPNHVTRFYAAEVVLAFEELHSKNIIYRDLKPENLLITAQGHLKITDFGFSKVVPDVTWTLCGTPDYLAPEIIKSKGYGKAVDWWALGILIYEMAVGYPPFYHEEHMKLYENILAGKPKFPGHFDANCKDLVKRLLIADLTKRFGNLKGGVTDIKCHKWFSGLDWIKLRALDIPAPYIPTLSGEGDTSNFDSYVEDHLPYGVTGSDPHKDKFKDF